MSRRAATRLAREATETAWAVPMVIAARLPGLMPPLSAADQTEAVRMVSEKWWAGAAAAQAMAMQAWIAQWRFATALWQPAVFGSLSWAPDRRLAAKAVAGGTDTLLAGLAPVRKAVLANRRRLARRTSR